MRTLFGESLRQIRLQRGLLLRKFAQSVDLDPSYYARIERGEVGPPNTETMSRIAVKLGIAPGVSSEWDDLMYRAAISRGRLPDEILENERITQLLPAFFAKLNQSQVCSAEEMYDVFSRMMSERIDSSDKPS